MSTRIALVRPAGAATGPPPLPAPTSLEESGLSLDLMTQLVAKTLYAAGELAGTELARRLGVLFGVIEPSIEFLKNQRQCEIVGGAMIGASSYRYRITTEGRNAAALFLRHNQYVGAAPVPLAQYCRYMSAFARTGQSRVTSTDVRRVFSHLVLGDHVID